jgi:hypothetical protein
MPRKLQQGGRRENGCQVVLADHYAGRLDDAKRGLGCAFSKTELEAQRSCWSMQGSSGC